MANNHATGKRCVFKVVDSPVRKLTLVATDEGLAAILWENDRPRRVRLNIEAEDDRHPVLVETARQLDEYFAGERNTFALPLDLAGTAFQRNASDALLTTTFGETRSYDRSRSKSRPQRRARRGRGQRQKSVSMSSRAIASSDRTVRSQARRADLTSSRAASARARGPVGRRRRAMDAPRAA